MLSTLVTALALASSLLPFAKAEVDRGIPWATNDNYATNFAHMPKLKWYHHWQDGPVSALSNIEYVPMYWGPSKVSQWNTRLTEMRKKTPQHLMGFNEPDIPSQSNVDPSRAAQLYMEQIWPWHAKGTKLGSPAIAWNLDWMGNFLDALHKKGGDVDFVCLHWYGKHTALNDFKNYVQKAHTRFGKDIWITELGITTASGANQAQVKAFLQQATKFLDSTGYVKRLSWFGGFETNHPPDNFATGLNGLIAPGGKPNDMGYWYGFTSAYWPGYATAYWNWFTDAYRRSIEEGMPSRRLIGRYARLLLPAPEEAE